MATNVHIELIDINVQKINKYQLVEWLLLYKQILITTRLRLKF